MYHSKKNKKTLRVKLICQSVKIVPSLALYVAPSCSSVYLSVCIIPMFQNCINVMICKDTIIEG